MRKITELAANNFHSNNSFNSGNTKVEVLNGDVSLYLHGNRIAHKDANGEIFISNCGWFTSTTKERLNGLNGVSIYQKKGEWFLNGQLWDGSLIKI